MRFPAFIAVFLALAFLVPPTMVAAPAKANLKEWTLLIYLDADNNLEGAGVHDVNELETVGSTDDINIVVLMDRSNGQDTSNGDWTGAKRYYITKDNDMTTINSQELADLGEVNMGDPQTFINFTTWAVDKYPAKRYLVDFWNHGGGFHGVCWDDDNKGDNLNMYNVTECLKALKSHLGRNIDLVGFDACLMAGVEILYSIRGTCDYAVTSGTTEPNDGWPYDWILPSLAMKPTMTAAEFAKEITEDYVNSYTDGKPDPQDTPTATMSAWNMGLTPNLFEQFNRLSMRLALKAFTYNAYLREVRANTQGYDPGHVKVIDVLNYPLYDIYDFTIEFLKPLGGPFAGLVMDKSLRDNIENLQKVIMGARIAERHGPQFPDGYGITMYWPSGDNQALAGSPKTQYDTRYDNIESSKDLYWDDFLKAYVSMSNVPNTPPSVMIALPSDGSVLDAAKGAAMLTGTAFDVSEVTAVEISIDNGTWKKVSGTKNWDYKWNIQQLKGKHFVSVRAIDSATESPVMTNEYTIKAAPPSPAGGPLGMGLISGAVLIIAALGALLILRKKKMKFGDLFRKPDPKGED